MKKSNKDIKNGVKIMNRFNFKVEYLVHFFLL